MRKHNLSMLLDLYEMTMANGIFQSEMKDTITYFDMFFRRVPDNGGFAVFAGLSQIVDYIENLKFSEEDENSRRESPKQPERRDSLLGL